MKTVNVLIASDCPLIYNGLDGLISNLDHIEVKGIVENTYDILHHLSIQEIDILILDYDAGFSGIDVIVHLNNKFPHVRSLVVLSSFDYYHVSKVKKTGAGGCIPLKLSMGQLEEEIAGFIHADQSRSFYLPKTSAITILPPLPGDQAVTQREKEIINLIAEGCSSKEIAAELCLSLNTVKAHRKNIFRKLNISSHIDLVKRFWLYALAG